MYEYEILFLETGERDIIFGYSFEDACIRSNIDPYEVQVLGYDYMD